MAIYKCSINEKGIKVEVMEISFWELVTIPNRKGYKIEEL